MVRGVPSVLAMLAAFALAGSAWGEEAMPEVAPPVAVAAALPAGWSAPERAAGGVSPGREEPKGPASEGVLEMAWEEYRSVIVVGAGAGVFRPAWVLTYQAEDGALVVAYRGVAFRDAKGVLHVDARDAVIAGPMADNWRADSFAVFAGGEVKTLDDQGSAQEGRIEKALPAEAKEYRGLLQAAEALVSDTG